MWRTTRIGDLYDATKREDSCGLSVEEEIRLSAICWYNYDETFETNDIKILTPNGFQSFDGVARYKHTKKVKNFGVYSALDHKFIIDGKEVFAKDLNPNYEECDEYFYDPVNVGNGNIYLHDNNLVSHNTFHGTGNTLINAEALLSLKAEEPIQYGSHNTRIYENVKENHEYMMFVDVAKGRGQDYSTFNIIDITARPFKQVCVFQDNNISPLLYPDIIYKYAIIYNNAYVIIESNDQGSVVCNGLYYELEYENVYVESMVKSDSIGATMTKKVKRIGCSNLKDLVEQNKILITDTQSIVELSTFEAKGTSYEASTGNHDDLVMNLVLFSWFTTTPFFNDLTDINLKHLLYSEKLKSFEDDIVPVGIFDDGRKERYSAEGGLLWESAETNLY